MKWFSFVVVIILFAGCGKGARNMTPPRFEVVDSVRLAVDYRQSLEQMIQACGFSWSHKLLTSENVPMPKHLRGSCGQVIQLDIIRLGDGVTTEKAFEKMKALGYRPATLYELLVYRCHTERLDRTVVALGTRIPGTEGRLFTPYTHEQSSKSGAGFDRYLPVIDSVGWKWFFRDFLVAPLK